MKDPFVDEVRKFRMEHTKQFGSDLHRICDDFRNLDRSLEDRLVTLKPRKIKRPERSSKPATTNQLNANIPL
ncbi:MAG: hypothetical protein KAR13_19835 [Desulfobulbaceae bacterium]|nr:hypothetical protein [Desulfobulbaceae bacterium]